MVALAVTPAQASTTASGPVDVLSAGSLQDLMQDQVGPAFQKATGYTLDNISMGSDRAGEQHHRWHPARGRVHQRLARRQHLP